MKVYRTGTLFHGLRTWSIDRETESFVILRELHWSEDCVNEKGVMLPGERTVRMKKSDFLFKKPFGHFREEDMPITIKSKP